MITGLSLGGAEVVLHNLLSEMDRGIAPTVVSLTPGGQVRERIEKLGVPVYDVGMRRGLPGPAAVWRLAALCRRVLPDVVQGWMYHGNLAATLASAVSPGRVPLAWAVHHSLHDVRAEKKLTAALIRLGARLSSLPARIVYVSRVSAAQHEAIGYKPDGRTVIPNGFDCRKLRPDAEAYASVRTELGLGPQTMLVGLIARYHPTKDHDNFLTAASRFVQRDENTCFLLAGRDVSPSNAELVAKISALGLGARIHLLGERNDVPRLLAALDILSSAAWGEAFPMVVGEAMACGVPCVVTDVGDSGWIVGDTGAIVPPRDPQALSAAWDGMVRMQRKDRIALGQRARQRVENEFSLAEISRRYEDLYAELSSFAPRA